jgi:hypothetical protein
MLYNYHKGASMQKPRGYFVIFSVVMAFVLSCGIPTSMPTLPKEVAIKAKPNLAMPLGRVTYNLYSGLRGENMEKGLGSLGNDIGWVEDLLGNEATLYDYRPADTADNTIQKFLVHYKLNLDDTTGGSNEFESSGGVQTINASINGLGNSTGLASGESGVEDFLPNYTYTGTYPEGAEDGIEMSSLPKGLNFYTPEEGTPEEAPQGGGVEEISGYLYINLKRQVYDGTTEAWVDEESGGSGYDADWRKDLLVDTSNLQFRVKYGEKIKDLFSPNESEQEEPGKQMLFEPLNLEDSEVLAQDTENENNPFTIYMSSSMPEPDKAIPIRNLAKVFNEANSNGEDMFFEYTVKLISRSGEIDLGEVPLSPDIELSPDIFARKVVVSADLLMIIPLKFLVVQTDPDTPVVMSIDPDVGGDLFGRSGPDDNEYLDMFTSFEFNISTKNLAGLKTGKFFMENKNGDEALEHLRLGPIIDLVNPKNRFYLDSGKLEEIKATWPFSPQILIEFQDGEIVEIERYFNIELQSITVKADGEFTFETGL